jgi:hypothetical protein
VSNTMKVEQLPAPSTGDAVADASVEGDFIAQACDSVPGPRRGVHPLPISTNNLVVHATMIA